MVAARPGAERYLLLGLELGRHEEGIVDAYVGPPELAAEAEAAPLRDPADLAAEADELAARLPDGWLRDQVAGLRSYASALAGARTAYADEVEGCYGVRPVRTDESVFETAHARLEKLLPGTGSLASRYRHFEDRMRVPADAVEELVTAAIQVARRHTRRIVDLPEGEGVSVATVDDVPWMAFCEYEGGLHSTITVNTALPLSAIELLTIAIHETYPGHHTERACKEELLVRRAGLLEETIVLVPTPQSLVAEGIAGIAPPLLLRGDAGPELAAVLAGAGVDLDLDLALAVRAEMRPCRWAEVDAALMLHDEGTTDDEARAHLERFGLLDEELSTHVVRFLREPASRTYIVTYPAGYALCDSYVGGDDDRLCALLTQQVRVGDLIAA